MQCSSGDRVTECGGRLASKDITKYIIACFEGYTMSRTDFKDYSCTKWSFNLNKAVVNHLPLVDIRKLIGNC